MCYLCCAKETIFLMYRDLYIKYIMCKQNALFFKQCGLFLWAPIKLSNVHRCRALSAMLAIKSSRVVFDPERIFLLLHWTKTYWLCSQRVYKYLNHFCSHLVPLVTQSFCQLVFFHFAQVSFILGTHRPCWSDHFGSVHSKREVHKLRLMRPTINLFQKYILNLC